MRTFIATVLLSGAVAAVGDRAIAQSRSIDLPPDNAMAALREGSGVDVVRRNCVMCHSTDYVVRQPPSDPKRWGAEVKKMIEVYGAPISEADAKIIVDYLGTAYGPAKVGMQNQKKAETPAQKAR